MRPVQERVARGAAWLDETVPGWWQRIDVETLDLADCEHCICGQVFADRADDPDVLNGFGVFFNTSLYDEAQAWLRARGVGEWPHASVDLGFNDNNTGFRPLDAEWRRVIAERVAGSQS